MTLDDYNDWLRLAQKHSRVEREAEDLLQDALLAAVEEERTDLEVDANRAWLAGVIRNLGAMNARSAARRKDREKRFDAAENSRDAPPDPEANRQGKTASGAKVQRVLQALPPAARQVALLVLHGLRREEIREALGLTDTALRQRFTSIRRALGPLPSDLQRDALAAAYARRRDRAVPFPVGLIRRALLRHLRALKQGAEESGGSAPRRNIGTHDPTGHLLVIRSRDEESE